MLKKHLNTRNLFAIVLTVSIFFSTFANAEVLVDYDWKDNVYLNEAKPNNAPSETFDTCDAAWVRATEMINNGAASVETNCTFKIRLVSSTGTPPGNDDPTQPSEPTDHVCSESIIHCVAPNGNAKQEYNNIQAAVNAASPGDQVWVYAGRYNGFVVDKTGTSSANILTIVAKESGVIIDKPVKVNGRESGILIADSDYVTIEGFEVNYQNTDSNSYGIAAREAYADDPMEGVVFRNNKVQNAGKNGLYFSNVFKGVLDGNEVFNNGEHGVYVANSGSDQVTIVNNKIHHNTNAGIHLNGDRWQPGGDGLQKGHVIEGNTINNNGQNGMNMDGIQDVVIKNNTIHDNARYAIRAFMIDGAQGPKNYTVINNTLTVPGNWESIVFSEDRGGHTVSNNQFGNCTTNCISYY